MRQNYNTQFKIEKKESTPNALSFNNNESLWLKIR